MSLCHTTKYTEFTWKVCFKLKWWVFLSVAPEVVAMFLSTWHGRTNDLRPTSDTWSWTKVILDCRLNSPILLYYSNFIGKFINIYRMHRSLPYPWLFKTCNVCISHFYTQSKAFRSHNVPLFLRKILLLFKFLYSSFF